MKVFMTGASGLIGRATTKELIANGYEVLGLARSEASAATIKSLGGTPHMGSLDNIESLKSGAAQSDAIVHMGFPHEDFSQDALWKAQSQDRAAISAMAEAVSGKNTPLIIASGTLTLAGEGEKDEESQNVNDGSAFAGRNLAGELVQDLSRDGVVKGMVVRFAPTVHGPDDKGLIPMAIKGMKAAGQAIYIGDGTAVWCACHVEDAASLLRLAIENGKSGAIYHAVTESAVNLKEVATLIGKKTDMPVVSLEKPEALQKLNFLGALLSLNNNVSSTKTKKELGWEPKHPGLLADMEVNYF